MRLHDPFWLFLLIPLAALFWWRHRRRYAVLYSDIADLRSLPVTWAQRVKKALHVLHFVALALLVVALTRPQQGREEFRVRTDGIAIEVCIDRSGSMQAEDFHDGGKRVNRLHIVKKVTGDFVDGRPDDKIGLVAFGGFASALCPLTLDHHALRSILDAVDIPEPLVDARGRLVDPEGYREELATAIGDAIAVGIARIRDAEAGSKVLILVSDGESNAGVVDPLEAADAARESGVKVYTVGVGSTGIAPVPRLDRLGRKVYERQMVRLDEATLKAIAEKTGGQYFNARDTATLVRVYEEIDRLEKTETEGVRFTRYRELYAMTLWPGLCLLVLCTACFATRFRTLP